jgi:hypothetical protein
LIDALHGGQIGLHGFHGTCALLFTQPLCRVVDLGLVRSNQQVKPFTGTQACKLKANAGRCPGHDRELSSHASSPADYLQVLAANERKPAAFLFSLFAGPVRAPSWINFASTHLNTHT